MKNTWLCRSHFHSWHSLGQSIRSNRKQRWGLRQNPKTEAFNKLKLTDTKSAIHEDELGTEKDADRLGESSPDGNSCSMNADSTHLDAKKYYRGRQLLQFDNTPRPAFYGIWPVKRLDHASWMYFILNFTRLCLFKKWKLQKSTILFVS